MRGRAIVAAALALAAAGAQAEILLWDNYPGGVLQNAAYNMSSERNTQVIESTWVADDVDLAQVPGADPANTLLTRLEWVGARHPGYGYGAADVILLDTGLATVAELLDLPYSYTDIATNPDLGPNVQAYIGEVTFDPPLAALTLGEHFYIGVRLVGDGYFEGRNHSVTSSVDSTLRGRTQGYTRAAIFGAPYWRPASEVWYGMPTGNNFEFAFRVYGEIIPEPAAVSLLAVGGLLLARRR